jgi:hypothetical protein
MAKKQYEWQGKLYTISELAEATGIMEKTLRSRLKHGWSVEKSIAQKQRRGPLYAYHGEMLTIEELVQRSPGLRKHCIAGRLHRGWNVEDAVDKPLIESAAITAAKLCRVKRAETQKFASSADKAAHKRYTAAKKIALHIVTGAVDDFNFRVVTPMLEYAFEGFELSYSIRFDSAADVTHAHLTAYYPRKGIKSTLNRGFVVNKDSVKEIFDD